MFWGKFSIRKNSIALFIIGSLAIGCKPNMSNSLRTRTQASASTQVVKTGEGYVLLDNPVILSGNNTLSSTVSLNKYRTVKSITTDSFLTGNTNCYGLSYCFEVKADETSASALQTADGKWGFDSATSEFLQVNTYYHINNILNQFVSDLDSAYSSAYVASTPYYDTSLPLANQQATSLYRFIVDSPLEAYAACDYADNAYYSNASNVLCFGYTSTATDLKWAEDSSIIYHESGHFLQYLQLNLRNNGILKKANMGNFFYDEAGSIGEGLSDYFSYYINQRTHFSEWAAGRYLNSSRPISEDDTLHISGLSKTSGERLSYPDFLNYDPNNHTTPTEDIHIAGMVISHFLVALTEDLMDKCSMTKRGAQTQVMGLITETLAELGDLYSVGTVNGAANRVNLNSTYAYEWQSKVNPLNYRSFSQTLAKFLLLNLGNPSLNRCNGTIYTTDQIEKIFDDYGLLLFRTYNENRNLSSDTVVAFNNTAVTATNRNKSLLIQKDLIKLDPTTNAASAYIIDKQSIVASGISSLQSAGLIGSLSSQTPSDLGFNNGNGKVSPGEVVGIALNLYNNSNATMGNVQVLANDWKNIGASGKPCIYNSATANDYDWTTETEGGESCSSVTAASDSDFSPICVMQYNGDTATTWVSQKVYKTKLALDKNFCLDSTNDSRDCFIRAIKGADQANYSKLDPKKNWFQTMQNPNTATAYSLDWGNVVLFEVSKHIPPGTVVDCRFRVRFTNCDDCYHDSTRSNYDFKDEDYNGPRPYKNIHLKLTIID